LKSKNGIKNRVTVVTRPVRDGKRHWVAADRKTDYQTYMPTYWLRWLTRGGANYKYECLGPMTFEQALIHRAKKEVEVLQEPSLEAAVKHVAPKTLEEWRTEFLHDKNTTLKKDGTPLDTDTIHSYEVLTREFLDIVKRTHPGEIVKQDMRDWIIHLRLRLKHRSVCNVYILIACYLKFCEVDHKKLLPQSERPTPVAHPPVTYTRDEMTKFFFNVLDERDSLAFEFLLKTGARKTEMTHCDWENNLPNLDSTHPTAKFFNKTDFRVKTGKYREVPLEKGLAAKLRAWRKKNPTTYLVFGTKDDTPEGNFLRAGKDAAERSGMKRSKFKLHRLRDTFATWHLRAGRDIRTVQHWLGHASIEMTQKYLAPQEGEEAQSQMNDTFSGMVDNVAVA
jgi:integrase